MRRILILTCLLTVPLVAVAGYGLTALSSGSLNSGAGHQGSGSHAADTPTEVGQSAFAAIAEIVLLLSKNPTTDWSKVNITRLRDHLVDMENLTLNANVKQMDAAGAIAFRVTGEGQTLRAIRTMVPAHGRVLSESTSWIVTSNKIDRGMVMTIGSEDASELSRIRALGFFGIMATGSHHQPHHLGMATGRFHH